MGGLNNYIQVPIRSYTAYLSQQGKPATEPLTMTNKESVSTQNIKEYFSKYDHNKNYVNASFNSFGTGYLNLTC